MYEARIEFTVGAVSFTGEGDKDWVASQLDKILGRAPELVKLTPQEQVTEVPTSESQQPTQPWQDDAIAQMPLPSLLREKGASTNQLNKFLATAVWLTAQGRTPLTTRDVTEALKESSQSRLGNASDCLNKNVAKGYCEKDGGKFFVTPEGKDSL